MERKILYPIIWGGAAIILIIFIYIKFYPKYYIDVSPEIVLNNKSEMYYMDLNNDGNTEKVHYCYYDKIFKPTLYLYNSDDIFISLWNLFESPVKNSKVYAGDYNHDNIKEFFLFTKDKDSLYLHVFNSFNDKDIIIKKQYLFNIQNSHDKFYIEPVGLYNLNESLNNEFLFTIKYDSIPQLSKIYAFDINNKTLTKSPDIETQLIEPVLVDDINNDGKIEIIISNSSFKNSEKGVQSQFIVLNNKLQYLFKPVKFFGSASKITTGVLQTHFQKYIAILHSGVSGDNIFNNFMLYDYSGKRISENTINDNKNLAIANLKSKQDELFFFTGKKLLKYNTKTKSIKNITVSSGNNLKLVLSDDIDSDGLVDHLFMGENSLTILSGNLKTTTSVDLKGEGKFIATISTLQNIPQKLSVQIGDKWYLLKYEKNKSFLFSKSFFIIIIIIILTVIFLIIKNKHQIVKKTSLKKKRKIEIDDLEKNINERISGLKDRVESYKGELKNDSYNSIIENLDETFEGVKTIIEENIKEGNKKINFSELVKKKQKDLITDVLIFPDDSWDEIKQGTKDVISEILEITFKYISEIDKNTELNIQLIHNSGNVNILFEIEKLNIDKTDFEKESGITMLVKKHEINFEIDHILEFGTVINITANIKTKDNKEDNNVKVIIAEDHDVSLFGLLSFLRTKKGIDVVGTAKNGMEVLKILETKTTDIIITDISMPGMDGIELTEKIQQEYPGIKVIVFTMYMENWFIEQLVNHGAKGFVSKNSKMAELVGAISSVNEGNNYYCPQFKSKFGFISNGSGMVQNSDTLTKNELLILAYYADGLTKEDIAEKMSVGKKMIDIFLANMLLKLNAGDEEELIYIAKKQKLISG